MIHFPLHLAIFSIMSSRAKKLQLPLVIILSSRLSTIKVSKDFMVFGDNATLQRLLADSLASSIH